MQVLWPVTLFGGQSRAQLASRLDQRSASKLSFVLLILIISGNLPSLKMNTDILTWFRVVVTFHFCVRILNLDLWSWWNANKSTLQNLPSLKDTFPVLLSGEYRLQLGTTVPPTICYEEPANPYIFSCCAGKGQQSLRCYARCSPNALGLIIRD